MFLQDAGDICVDEKPRPEVVKVEINWLAMPYSRHIKQVFFFICLFVPIFVFARNFRAGNPASEAEQVADIIKMMETAYAGIEAYQTDTEVNEYRDGRLTETKRFLYTFKKPDHIRIDMETPKYGWILVYPDKKGKVIVKPSGWTGFMKLHLSLDSTFLKNDAGQRIDQTNLGFLIRNISLSLTDKRRGKLKISERDSLIIIQVLADDHFLTGIRTMYRFFIDRSLCLPVEVEEFNSDGIIKRKVIFRDMRTSIILPEAFFQVE